MHTDYIRALLVLQREASREVDRAQLAEAPDPAFAQAVINAMTERRRLTNPEVRD